MTLNLPTDNEQPWGAKIRAALTALDVRPLADGTVTNIKVAPDAAISADKLVDGTSLKLLTAAERVKLAGVTAGATVNATDVQLRDRTTHGGFQLSTTISDLTEAVQDKVAAFLVAGANVTVDYNDAANTLTIAAAAGAAGGLDAEAVRDTIGAALAGVAPVSVVVNDAADTITISTTATTNSTDAQLRDRTTHQGMQPVSTVTGLGAALDSKLAFDDASVTNPRIPVDASVTDAKVAAGAAISADKLVDGATNQLLTAAVQTIAGIKTFNASPVVPEPTTASQAATKAYVDAAIAAALGGVPPPTGGTNLDFGTSSTSGSQTYNFGTPSSPGSQSFNGGAP